MNSETASDSEFHQFPCKMSSYLSLWNEGKLPYSLLFKIQSVLFGGVLPSFCLLYTSDAADDIGQV